MKAFAGILAALLMIVPTLALAALVVEGDSLFSVNNGLPNWTAFYSGAVFNYAAGGDTVQSMVAEYDTEAHTRASPTNTFILEGGINDIFAGQTASALFTDAMMLVHLAQRDEMPVFVVTVAPYIGLSAAKNNIRLQYNQMLRDNARWYGYAVMDIAGFMPYPTNHFYYQPDGLHWTAGLQRFLGQYYIPSLLAECDL